MRDDLSAELASAVSAEREEHRPDLAWVVKRGRRVRRLRRLVASGALVAVITAGAVGVNALQNSVSPRPIPQLINPATPDVQEPERGEVVEEIPEETRAEIFAFRALAATGLMDPLGSRTYNWTYADDTAFEDGRYRVGFAASDCAPQANSQTCTGLSGEDPRLGNALTDTYVVVVRQDGTWRVTDVEGNMLPDERERVVGFSLPDRREPSHWDFASTAVWQLGDESSTAMTPIWVGPYPTEAPGSVCRVQPLDEAGAETGRESAFYQPPPDRPFERGGWGRGGGTDLPPDAADVRVDCRQYTGRVWEVSGDPELVTAGSDVVGISAELIWRGREGFTTGVRCEGTLVDAEGNVVFEGSGRAEPLWRPGELKNYPYETTVVITTRGEPVAADTVGEFECRSV